MKIKKEKKGQHTKFTAETDYLELEAVIDKNGYGHCKLSSGGEEIDTISFSSIRNWIQFSKEYEESYRILAKFLSQIKKTEKISDYISY